MRAVGRNACLLLDRAADTAGYAGPALVTPDRRTSYGELHDASMRVCAALRERGVRPGERVLLVLDDGLPFAATFFGALRAGVVPVAVNPYYNAAHYQYFVEDARPRVAFVEADASELLSETAGLEVIVSGGETSGDGFTALLGSVAPDVRVEDVNGQDAAFMAGPRSSVHLL